jgi:hypothetical protein
VSCPIVHHSRFGEAFALTPSQHDSVPQPRYIIIAFSIVGFFWGWVLASHHDLSEHRLVITSQPYPKRICLPFSCTVKGSGYCTEEFAALVKIPWFSLECVGVHTAVRMTKTWFVTFICGVSFLSQVRVSTILPNSVRAWCGCHHSIFGKSSAATRSVPPAREGGLEGGWRGRE